jgi:hypothetical protein
LQDEGNRKINPATQLSELTKKIVDNDSHYLYNNSRNIQKFVRRDIMFNMLYGLKDIHTVISNHRKIGGAAEAEMIRLSSGETYHNPVFTNVDISRGQYVSICFIDENGTNIIAHVDQIGVIKGLEHKLICQLNNTHVKQLMLQDTLQYLQKLCEVNDGFVTNSFKKEAIKLVRDISIKELNNHNVALPFPIEENIIHLNKRLYA